MVDPTSCSRGSGVLVWEHARRIVFRSVGWCADAVASGVGGVVCVGGGAVDVDARCGGGWSGIGAIFVFVSRQSVLGAEHWSSCWILYELLRFLIRIGIATVSVLIPLLLIMMQTRSSWHCKASSSATRF